MFALSLITENPVFIYLFGFLRRFQHCTGHITTGSWKGRGNQYIEFARVLYCKLPTNGKQLPAFPLEAMSGIQPRPQRWDTGSLVSGIRPVRGLSHQEVSVFILMFMMQHLSDSLLHLNSFPPWGPIWN